MPGRMSKVLVLLMGGFIYALVTGGTGQAQLLDRKAISLAEAKKMVAAAMAGGGQEQVADGGGRDGRSRDAHRARENGRRAVGKRGDRRAQSKDVGPPEAANEGRRGRGDGQSRGDSAGSPTECPADHLPRFPADWGGLPSSTAISSWAPSAAAAARRPRMSRCARQARTPWESSSSRLAAVRCATLPALAGRPDIPYREVRQCDRTR